MNSVLEEIGKVGLNIVGFFCFLVMFGLCIAIKNSLVEAWKRGRHVKRLKKF